MTKREQIEEIQARIKLLQGHRYALECGNDLLYQSSEMDIYEAKGKEINDLYVQLNALKETL